MPVLMPTVPIDADEKPTAPVMKLNVDRAMTLLMLNKMVVDTGLFGELGPLDYLCVVYMKIDDEEDVAEEEKPAVKPA